MVPSHPHSFHNQPTVMKRNSLLYVGSMILCVSFLFFSCKKQVVEDIALQSSTAPQSVNGTECRPAVFGAYSSSANPANDRWITLAQKWYSNGKVKYLKAKSARFSPVFFADPFLELMYDLDWGEVVYEGSQVYLKDVPNNRNLMRVTLDDQGRPAASYYYYQQVGTLTYWYDTTYYYYNGERLDDMISLYHTNEYGTVFPIHSWRRYKFLYDSWGNVIGAGLRDGANFKIDYDYTKPVQGITLNYQLTSSLSLLEHMELLKLPMHHAVIKIGYGDIHNSTEYKDYEIVDGLVRSYVYVPPYALPQDKTTFYNGWECGTNNSLGPGNGIANLQQFQKLFPAMESH